MPHRSDPLLAVLHGVRIRGVADEQRLAGASGLERSFVEEQLCLLEARGDVRRRTGRRPGWALTPSGRSAHERLLSADLRVSRCAPALEGAYSRFADLNVELLSVCTDWQRAARAGASKRSKDELLSRHSSLHERALPLCRDLESLMERFGSYGPRLEHARRALESGEADWMAAPWLDSYHTVWFELHEDLLLTLGRSRKSEAVG